MEGTTKSDDSSSYEATLEYIAQIEQEIATFNLLKIRESQSAQTATNIASKSPVSLNSHSLNDKTTEVEDLCDVLLDKLSELNRDLSQTDFSSSCSPPPPLVSPNDVSHFHSINRTRMTSNKSQYPHSQTTITAKRQNRYSIYDNSTKIAIYDATASLLKTLPVKSSREQIINAKAFGGHPSGVANDGRALPDFIEAALIYLSKFGLNSVGIFRKSGVKSRINALKASLERHELVEFESLCVYDVADLVKTWIRELSPHLISKSLIDAFTRDPDSFSLWQLEDGHRYLLYCILKFLSNVAENSSQNQMNIFNLAVCFAPSMCEFENEFQIADGQKCLEHCIENHEFLFDVGVSLAPNRIPLDLYRHTASAVINASPLDILTRIRLERNLFDPLINDWTIKEQSGKRELFEMTYKFSQFLPVKTFQLRRYWNIVHGAVMLREECERYCSTWSLQINGAGSTQVIHEVEIDIGGFSHHWYTRVFAVLHDQMMKSLISTFDIDTKYSRLLVSEV